MLPMNPLFAIRHARRYLWVARVAAFACSMTLGSSAAQSVQPAGPEATLLPADHAIERQVAHGERHRYRLAVGAGEYVHLIVEQRGIDVVAQVLGPDGAMRAEFQDAITSDGREDIEVVADAAGTYTFSIEPAPGIIVPGAYAIRLDSRRAATAADRTLQEARTLRVSAMQRTDQDDAAGAVRLLERALTLTESVKGPEDREVGDVAEQMAGACFDRRDMARAESLYVRAVAILDKTLGVDHPAAAVVRSRLARVYRVTGQRLKAEALVRPALEIIEKTLGTDHVFYAAALSSLQVLRDEASDFEESVAIAKRQLAILDTIQYTDSILYAQVLNNLGSAYVALHDATHAEDCLRRSIALFEKLRGPDAYLMTSPLANLGRLLATERGDYAAAEAAYLRAIAIRERVVGPDNPDLMLSLNNLANIYFETRDTVRARALYFRALRIGEHAYGSYHRFTFLSTSNIAETYKQDGDIANAIVFERRAEAIVETQLALNLAVGSERQKLVFVRSISNRMDRTISLHLQGAPADPDAGALAALVVLQRKGRVLDAMTDTFAGVRQRVATPKDHDLLDQLNATTVQLAGVALTAPETTDPEARLAQIKTLEARKEQLEIELGDHNAEFRAQVQPVTLEAVQAALPEDAALVEFVVYRPYNPQANTERDAYGLPHYAAYVIRNGAAPLGVDLGPAKAIDDAIGTLRAALGDPARRDFRRRARAMEAQVIQPLRAALGHATHLLISPDGDLNLVPFDALVDAQGRYLIERYTMTYLTSGRDLLRMQVPRASHGDPVIVADPIFGEPPTDAGAETANQRSARRRDPSASLARRRVTMGDDLSTMYFAPLPATATEARAIKVLFPESTLFTGERATKAILQHVDAPSMLHIASHGFFLRPPDEKTPAPAPAPAPASASASASAVAPARAAAPASAKVENPLLRSGLALAGANLAYTGHNEGILTALEASGLNLWGTKLVTLSACDTGVGDVRNGEGVYGLRRAFVLAGAETLVMSLWPVSDYVTREMMTAYYKGLRAGLGRGEALRRAKLALLRRPGRRHPFYWANFIQSGEWADLSGQR
jgi:CHAT domain-containing protein/tetratricopeptide (TPR) repeat protein